MINNGHFASEEIQAKVGGLTVSIALMVKEFFFLDFNVNFEKKKC